jgi:hypothetical protein
VQLAARGDLSIPVHGGEGSDGVLNAQYAKVVPGVGYVPLLGSSYIQVVGFDRRGPVVDAILTYSQSTDPASPHFADQTRLYAEKRWIRFPFSKAEIATDPTATREIVEGVITTALDGLDRRGLEGPNGPNSIVLSQNDSTREIAMNVRPELGSISKSIGMLLGKRVKSIRLFDCMENAIFMGDTQRTSFPQVPCQHDRGERRRTKRGVAFIVTELAATDRLVHQVLVPDCRIEGTGILRLEGAEAEAPMPLWASLSRKPEDGR